jgi:hypothetical protein
MMKRHVLLPALALMSVAAVVGEVVTAQVITAREVHSGGGWKTDGKAQRSAQRWNLDVQRSDDDSIRGRISVADSPLFTDGNVEGKIDGRIVTGTISDDQGNQIATFTGIVTENGMSGKYTDRTGEVGEWNWDGAVPR